MPPLMRNWLLPAGVVLDDFATGLGKAFLYR
jgi:hypothetical protein